MEYSFSPSVNIVRDADKSLRYIPTTNSKNVFKQILNNFPKGVHAFNIIGSYGTGKSAFLWALTKHLNDEDKIFMPFNGHFNECKQFKFINLIGQSRSIIDAFADLLSVDASEKAILDYIKKEHTKLKKNNICLVILIDEFGKYLEHAAKNDPDRELYFIQRLAEFANDSRRNILFISTLHQNFDAYAIGLGESQKKEWEKVKGRLKELTFNEPVEQLLNLAADFISKQGYKNVPKVDQKLLKVINSTGAFNLLNEVSDSFVKKLFPFDLLSAMVLTLSLQKYGQNERSLFNFLETDEFLGLNSFEELRDKNPYYNLSCVYNYLQYNYYSVLTSKFNPDYFKWTTIRNSLDRVEIEFSKNVIEAQSIVKVIGLLNILGSKAAKLNKELLTVYGKVCLAIKNPKSIIDQLEQKKIIRYQSFKNRYKLFEGTDIDIEKLHLKAKKEIGQVSNIVEELKYFLKFKYVPAKAITYQKGTPRFFQFKISETPIATYPNTSNEIDGLVNLVFNSKLRKTAFDIKKEPIIYGLFKRPQELEDYILEIKAVDQAIKELIEDPVAKEELLELKNHITERLNNEVNESLFGDKSSVKWYYNGEEVKIKSKRSFNVQLSRIIEDIYPDTPVFRNELMNKSKVSSSIHYAKKQYIEALIDNWNKPDLGFSDRGVPPQKTIFYTLLRNTGIHIDENPITANFSVPNKKSSFNKLWKVSQKYLDSTKSGKRSLAEFIEILRKRPFKLKDGLIEFWMISFLFIKREDFALFRNGAYEPLFTLEVGELLFKEANKFQIKAFDISGIKLDLFNKYRTLVQKETKNKATATSFQETAKPFLVFYKQLPKYAQQTKSISHDAIAFREVIKNAKELERTFFEDLPSCFGVSLTQLSKSRKELDAFVGRINICITELRTTESSLYDRVEKQLLKYFGFKKSSFDNYKSKIIKRYSSLKEHLLSGRLEVFYNRLGSKLPDRQAWLNSIVHAMIGKRLNEISDEDELLIYDRLENSLKDLDNLLEISQVDFDEETEEVIKLELTSSDKDIFQKNIILSKEQKRGSKTFEKKLRALLGSSKDEQLNQALLIKLLKESLNNE